jgi:anti-sigma factor RsiW
MVQGDAAGERDGGAAGAADITCQEVVGLLTDYLEGVMPAAERARLEAHLRTCDGCVNYLDQLRRTIQVTGTLAEGWLPPETAAKLVAAFRAWRG